MMFLLWALLLLVSSVVLNGAVLVKLWLWFLVPFGLPVITIPLAIGISLIVRYLTYQMRFDEAPETPEIRNKKIAYGIGMPLGTLFFGWIIHLFM